MRPLNISVIEIVISEFLYNNIFRRNPPMFPDTIKALVDAGHSVRLVSSKYTKDKIAIVMKSDGTVAKILEMK